MNAQIGKIKAHYSNVVQTALDHTVPRVSMDAHKHFSVLGVFGAIFGLAVFMTAAFLRSQVEPGSMFTNFVSSLGWGPNGAHEAFKFGLTILGLVLVPYVLFLIAKLRHHATDDNIDKTVELTHSAAKYWLIAVAGLWVLAWFIDIRVPSFSESLFILAIHGVGAASYFVCSIVGVTYLTRAMAVNGMSTRIQYGILAFIVFSTIGMGVSIVPMVITAFDAGLFNDMFAQGLGFTMTADERVQWIASMTNASPWSAFFEWMVVLSMLGWFAVTGTQTYFHPPQASDEQVSVVNILQ